MILLRAIMQLIGRVSCDSCGKSYWWVEDHSCEDAVADPLTALSTQKYFDGLWRQRSAARSPEVKLTKAA